MLEKLSQRSARNVVLLTAGGMAVTGAALIVGGLLSKVFFAPGSLGATFFTATTVLLTTGVAGSIAGPALMRSSVPTLEQSHRYQENASELPRC